MSGPCAKFKLKCSDFAFIGSQVPRLKGRGLLHHVYNSHLFESFYNIAITHN